MSVWLLHELHDGDSIDLQQEKTRFSASQRTQEPFAELLAYTWAFAPSST